MRTTVTACWKYVCFIAALVLCVSGSVPGVYAQPEGPVITTNEGADFSTNSPSAEFSGTHSSDTVAIYVNGAEDGVSLGSGDDSWTFATTTDLTEGDNVFSVTARDADANESAETTITIIYDTVPPVSSVSVPEQGTAELSIEWTASDGEGSGVASAALWYKKEADGTWTDTGTSASSVTSGTFIYTPADGDGTYYFASLSQDNAGNSEAEPTGEGDGNVVIGSSAPEPITITTESGEAYSTPEDSVTLEGTCPADTPGIYVNDAQDGVTHTLGDTTWGYTSGTLAEGENTFRVAAKDAEGNIISEASIVVTYAPPPSEDTEPPVSSATAPANGSGELSIEWTASDEEGSGVASTALWYKKEADGTWADTGTSASSVTNGTFAYTPADGHGTYYFATLSTDNAGNAEAEPEGEGDSQTLYETETTSIEAPVISEDYTIADGSVTLSGTCVADTAAIEVNAAPDGVTYTAGETSWTYTGELQSGENTFGVKARDAAGNLSDESTIVISHDDQAPTSEISTLEYLSERSLSIAWTASDNSSGVASTLLWFKKDADGAWADTGIDAQEGESGTFVYVLPEEDGMFYFATRATDNAGNTEADPTGEGDIQASYDSTPPDPPVILADYTIDDATVTFSGTCTADVTVIYVNGSADGVTWTSGDTSWTYTGPLAQGENTFNVTAKDAAANESEQDSVTVSYEPPSASEDVTAPSSSASAPDYGNGVLSVTWTASDDISGVALTQLWFKKEADGTWADTGTSAGSVTSGEFVYTPADGDGVYYFATRSTDNVGNEEAVPEDDGDDSTVYDTVPPDAPVISEDQTISETSVTLNGTCAADTLSIYVNDSPGGVTYSSGATTWAYSGTLREGDNAFSVTADDIAGNLSTAASVTIPYESPLADSVAITLEWDPDTEDDLDHYVLCWGIRSGNYSENSATIAKSSTSHTVTNLLRGQLYYFAVKSVYADGQSSEYSNEAAIPSITTPQNGFFADENSYSAYTVSGTSAEAASVEIFSGDTLVGTATASENQAAWSATVDFSPLEEGTVTLKALSTGAESDLLAGSLDKEAPDETPPESLAAVTGYKNGPISVYWTASDDRAVGATELWYKKEADGTWADAGLTTQEGESGTFIYMPSDGDGTYYFATRSTDKAGNTEADPTGDGDASAVYDTVAPASPDITTNFGDDYASSDMAVSLSGTCAADTLTIYVNGGMSGVTHTSGDTSWQYSGTLSQGDNSFQVIAEDMAGNTSSPDTIMVSYVSQPDGMSITLEWDPVTDAGFDHYELYWGTSSRNYPFNSTDDSEDVTQVNDTSFTITGLIRDRLYYFAVRAVYADGYHSDYSNEAAIPSITSPRSGFYVDDSNYNDYTVSGTAAEFAEVEIFSDDMLLGTATAKGSGSGATWTAAVDFTPATQGEVSLSAISTGATSGSVEGNYDTVSDDLIEPSSEATAPATGNGELMIEWTAWDDRGVASTELWYKKGTDGIWQNTGASASSATSGTFYYTPADGDGTYYFAVRATDTSGNPEHSPTGVGDTRTIYDTTPPEAPSVSNDYTVEDSTVTLSGTCPADTTAILVNGSSEGVIHTPGDTTWTYTSPLAPGENIFGVTARDAAGNVSAEDSIRVGHADTIAPASSADSPEYGNGDISVIWTAEDDLVGLALTELWVKKDTGGTWATAGVQSQRGTEGTFSYTPKAGDGVYYFATRSIDTAGNTEADPTGNGDTRTIVDTVPPDAPRIITESADEDLKYFVSLSGTCASDTVAILVDGSATGVEYDSGETSWRYEGNLLSGVNTFAVTARDAAGNESSPDTATVSYEPPDDDSLPPDSGVTEVNYRDGKLEIEWEAWDEESGTALTELWCKEGDDGVWNKTSHSSQRTSGTFLYVPEDGDGVYYFATRSVDNSGNTEARPSGDGDASIVYDTVPPDSPVIITRSGADFSTDNYEVRLDGTCGGDAIAIHVNGSANGVSYTPGSTSWRYDGTLVTGENLFEVRAEDAGTNMSDPASVRVTYSPPPDITPPTSTASAPEYGNGALSITWTASDDTSGVASTRLWYKKGTSGTWKDTGTSAGSVTSGEFIYTPKDGDGTYYFATRSTDNQGNAEVKLSGDGDTHTIYDTVPPAVPVISSKYSIVNALIELDGTCASDTAVISVSGSTIGVTYTAGDTSWQYDGKSPLEPYTTSVFEVIAEDAAGNVSAKASISVFYEPEDTTAPESEATAPACGTGRLSIVWTASDDLSGVASTRLWYKKSSDGTWTDTGLSPQTGTSTGSVTSGEFFYTPKDGDGTYYFATRSTDNIGNAEAEPYGIGYSKTIYDTVSPDAPVITTSGGRDYSIQNKVITLEGTCGEDAVAIYVNGSTDGVTYPGAFPTAWTYEGILQIGDNVFAVTAEDRAGNVSQADLITVHFDGSSGDIAVTLEWDTISDADFDYYVLYWGTASRDYNFDSITNDEDVIENNLTSFTVINLEADELWYFAVKAVYTDGSSGDFSNEAAIPSLTTPDEGFHFNGNDDSVFTVSGTSAELAEVSVFAGDTLLGIATSGNANEGATWSEELDFSVLTKGPVTLTARSTGATSEAVKGSYGEDLYDQVAPVSLADAPRYANQGHLSVKWTASDNMSGVAETALWYKKEADGGWSSAWLPSQEGTSGEFIFTPEGDGTYYFATRSTDNEGNTEKRPTGSGDDSTLYDTHAPDTPVITTNSGQDYQTSASLAILEGTCAKDTDAIYVNGSANGVSHTAGETTWSYSGTLSEGENSFVVAASDMAQNGSVEALIRVTYVPPDVTPPASEATAPAYGNGELTIGWTASDDDSGVASVTLWYKKGDDGTWADTGTSTGSVTSGVFIYTPTDEDGTYHFATRATDQAGNTEAEPTGDGDAGTVFDTAPPDVPEITTGDGYDVTTTESSFTLAGTCAPDTAAIYVNGSAAGVTYTAGSGSWTYTTVLQTGDNLFRVSAEDNAGNMSFEDTIHVHYQSDMTPPESGATAPAYGKGTLSILWTSSDENSGVASTELWHKKNADGVWAATGTSSTSTGSVTSGEFIYTPKDGDGTYYFATRSTDNAGNVEAAPAGDGDTRTIVDTVSPEPPVITTHSGEDYFTSETSALLNGSCGADTAVIYVNGTSDGVIHMSGETFWNYSGTLDSGENGFEVRAEDAAGNLSDPVSITVTLTDAPVGGYTEGYVLPADQVTQSANGDGIVTVVFKLKDLSNDDCVLKDFQYSLDNGDTWTAPSAGDDSQALSAGWQDNNGETYSSGSDFDDAEEHAFTIDTTHPDLPELNNMQAETELVEVKVMIRFTVSDGTYDSLFPVTSEAFSVDNLWPTVESHTLGSNSIDLTYSEAGMRNAARESAYALSPPVEITEISALTDVSYRMILASVPANTILTLTLTGITDAVGNPVTLTTLVLNDDDEDGLPDDWESANGVTDPDADPDGDGLTNKEELENGTSPTSSDSDGDDLPDGWEIANDLDPKDADGNNGKEGDPDNDGWTNYEEYLNDYDPQDDRSPEPVEPTPPQIIEVIPHDGAGIGEDKNRIPGNTSFYARIQDDDGIDVTNSDSIVFSVDDGVNAAYTRNLEHNAVRWLNLTGDADTRITELWAVYDRSEESELGKYPYGATVTLQIDAKDRRRGQMDTAIYQFRIETIGASEIAQENLPQTVPVDPADPALEGTYDVGVEVREGDLEGAKILYDSDEPVPPTFGPENEVPALDIAEQPVGVPMNLQPSTVFNTPVKLFIACPGIPDVAELSIYFYDGISWHLGCDTEGNVLAGSERWMEAGSRVNYNDGDVPVIEIRVWHFSAVQAGYAPKDDRDTDEPKSGGGGGGCFITTASASSAWTTAGLAFAFVFVMISAVYLVRRFSSTQPQ